MRDAVAIWVVLAVAYMVFAGSLSLNEALAGLVCATLATLWWWTVGRRGDIHFYIDRATFPPLGRALRGIPRQTVRIGLHLVGTVLGRAGGGTTRDRSAVEWSWATPTGDTAPAARAVGLLAASLAPDSYVLILDREHGTVTTHDLEDALR